MQTYTREEVAKHNTENDCWLIIHNKVYNITKFLRFHPGGKLVIVNEAGTDATENFDLYHNLQVLTKYDKKFCIGKLAEKDIKKKKKQKKGHFGSIVPHAENYWYQGHHSPYYKKSHENLRVAMRKFMKTEVLPNVIKWDETRVYPKDLHTKFAKAGLYQGLAGNWNREYAGDFIAGGVKPEEWDYFHELVLYDEVSKCASVGVSGLLSEGIALGIPPILQFGTKELKERIARPVFKGEKIICLAITEPYAGSDVANLKCTAKKSECGKFYIVNGQKKWITSGEFSDFFTVAVRTGGKGMKGLSLLLIERFRVGVKTRHMKCSGGWASGTSFLNFTDVKVPVENLIGKENHGFKYIMYNFNHERFTICAQNVGLARVCYEAAFTYVNQRKVFGKALIENPVVRNKLGHMLRKIESTQCWLEHLTYQMCKMSHREAMGKLGGDIALLKAHSAKIFEECAREGGILFGGYSYTRGGRGAVVETLFRDAKAMTILGGAEDVMIDLGVREAQKLYLRSKL